MEENLKKVSVSAINDTAIYRNQIVVLIIHFRSPFPT